ncbi:2Fe-2S iron-sulfur cluster-binding protein [Neorhizobium galegae]|uniref:2Fe-2S ferredoxin-type domain-containing protein n=2 Tax=Neorhizobium galegae bv. officinalis TaxID=323656 RepID=A0A0T7G0C3_NEOGA|nr:2Fe-2S iron-sulfur cluster-binding protein [Neorhizobium galegae]KAA9382362.1 2Fe-2S iron-sulfur cluster binding domain-containing protein [Neorhizobium galegae]KAB1109671.1 2Fe-2S iron-sulfur cluster binding domain-containing protein [Neorhizobium galegae]MCM2501650.1 2Fe-2S iron-sulfur cluster-binding protein [Neorhizobium galegae]MCQ1766737.1 2Fe-2S iron-sulfur cluster-binding protein [Neorhizobium galegae]MCQ1775332.1 2Fe-2S iron-sulfur cluster-binding protein [Neorhizobium galegae]
MTTIHFQSPSGEVTTLKGVVGQSIMELATSNGVSAIEADCGGACACATCHVIVDQSWTERLPAPGVMERDMLDFVAEPTSTSRLSCQLHITDDHDGLLLHLPSKQS